MQPYGGGSGRSIGRNNGLAPMSAASPNSSSAPSSAPLSFVSYSRRYDGPQMEHPGASYSPPPPDALPPPPHQHVHGPVVLSFGGSRYSIAAPPNGGGLGPPPLVRSHHHPIGMPLATGGSGRRNDVGSYSGGMIDLGPNGRGETRSYGASAPGLMVPPPRYGAVPVPAPGSSAGSAGPRGSNGALVSHLRSSGGAPSSTASPSSPSQSAAAPSSAYRVPRDRVILDHHFENVSGPLESGADGRGPSVYPPTSPGQFGSAPTSSAAGLPGGRSYVTQASYYGGRASTAPNPLPPPPVPLHHHHRQQQQQQTSSTVIVTPPAHRGMVGASGTPRSPPPNNSAQHLLPHQQKQHPYLPDRPSTAGAALAAATGRISSDADRAGVAGLPSASVQPSPPSEMFGYNGHYREDAARNTDVPLPEALESLPHPPSNPKVPAIPPVATGLPDSGADLMSAGLRLQQQVWLEKPEFKKLFCNIMKLSTDLQEAVRNTDSQQALTQPRLTRLQELIDVVLPLEIDRVRSRVVAYFVALRNQTADLDNYTSEMGKLSGAVRKQLNVSLLHAALRLKRAKMRRRKLEQIEATAGEILTKKPRNACAQQTKIEEVKLNEIRSALEVHTLSNDIRRRQAHAALQQVQELLKSITHPTTTMELAKKILSAEPHQGTDEQVDSL